MIIGCFTTVVFRPYFTHISLIFELTFTRSTSKPWEIWVRFEGNKAQIVPVVKPPLVKYDPSWAQFWLFGQFCHGFCCTGQQPGPAITLPSPSFVPPPSMSRPHRRDECVYRTLSITPVLSPDGKCKFLLKIFIATPQHNRNCSNFSRLSIFGTSIHTCKNNNRNLEFLIEVMGSENILWLWLTHNNLVDRACSLPKFGEFG